jgi:hypothetical protein
VADCRPVKGASLFKQTIAKQAFFCYYKVMEEETRQKFLEINEKLDKIYKSTERTRKYFLWTMIISIVVIVLPLVGLAILIPVIFSTFSGIGGGGGDVNSTLDALGL